MAVQFGGSQTACGGGRVCSLSYRPVPPVYHMLDAHSLPSGLWCGAGLWCCVMQSGGSEVVILGGVGREGGLISSYQAIFTSDISAYSKVTWPVLYS